MVATVPGPRAITDALFQQHVDHIVISDWLGKYLGQLGLSEVHVLEVIDELHPRISSAIDSEIQRATSRGVRSRYVWADDGRTTLARPAKFMESAEADVEHLAAKTRDGIYDSIGVLSGHQFEAVCLFLLHLYGIDPANGGLVGRSGDEGFDFYGALIPYPRPGADRLYTLGRRFVGQSKLKWNATVDSDTIAAFGRRLTDLRLGKPAPELIPAAFLSGSEPFVGLFVTGGRLGPAARNEARRQVIHYIEGDQVAEDLAHSPVVQQWIDPATANFDPSRFMEAFS